MAEITLTFEVKFNQGEIEKGFEDLASFIKESSMSRKEKKRFVKKVEQCLMNALAVEQVS